MSTIKISELQEVTELTSTDVIPLVTNNETKKISVGSLDKKYATNDKVDNIKTIENGEIFLIEVPKIPSSGTAAHSLMARELTAAQQESILYVFNYCLENNIKYPILKVRSSAETTEGCGSNIFYIRKPIPTPEHLAQYIFEFASIGVPELTTTNVPTCRLTLTLLYDKNNGYWFNTSGKVFEMYIPSSRLATTTYTDNRYLSKINETEYTPTANYHPATKKYVDDTITKLADMGFTPVIVETLPTSNIKTNTIYMIPGEDGEGENIYEEWMYINGAWEKVGSTGKTSGGNENVVFLELTTGISTPNNAFPSNSTTINANDRQTIADFMNTYWDGSKFTKRPVFIFNKRVITYHEMSANPGTQTIFYFYTGGLDGNNVSSNNQYPLFNVEFSFAFTGNVGEYVPYYSSSFSYWGIYSRSIPYLNMYNTQSYTPTGNYNPATKKYVDDSIKTSITSALGGDY